jgi:hypothetical protein
MDTLETYHSPTLSYSLQPPLLSHHLLHNRRKNPKEKTPVMEKNEMPIVGASDVAASASVAGTSAAALVQAPVVLPK